MTDGTAPTRQTDNLADVVEMLLDKGVVINADIAVSVGETELLGIELRAAIASFETASQYGLEFPEGTDTERVEAASQRRGLGASPERGASTDVETVDLEEGTTGDGGDPDGTTGDGDDPDGTTGDGDDPDGTTGDGRPAERTTEADGTDDR
ncbi:gas vesicle protein [Halorubrum sp. Hd13]|uniref:gas vesicle protein GvpJ n=1 Tax=Halorubrum sp. Hd13 TaxID=1480728 RepID=UPI000BCA137D|nr:hypothetical protein DJ81_16095 [Halorubrum sp. Hd13]